jgi:hypothetical protein
VQDERWYKRTGRWDCIWTMPRPEGGLYGYWTASPQEQTGGRFGFGKTEDGLTWQALPPPRVEGAQAGEVGAVARLGGRLVMLYGQQGMMVALLAERPEGPFVAADSNFSLLSGHTYFARFLPTSEGLLVNHHSIARGGDVYLGLLKILVADDEGTLRLGWWNGNERLKTGATRTPLAVPAVPADSAIAMLAADLNTDDGIILEARVTLPRSDRARPVGLYVECTPRDGSAILFDAQGRAELGGMRLDGTAFQAEKTVDRQMDFGGSARLRLCLQRSLLEVYLDDILIECFSLPHRCSGRVGAIRGDGTAGLRDLTAWSCAAR